MTLAPRPRAPCSREAKPKNFLSFLFAAPPPLRREAEILKGRKFLVLPPLPIKALKVVINFISQLNTYTLETIE